MASNGATSDGADDLPPSCRYVLHVLEAEGALTRQELLAETTLPEPTLDRAVSRLQNDDYVVKSRKSNDLRKVVIELRDVRTYNTPESDRF